MVHRFRARLAHRGLLRGALTIAAGTGLAQAITMGVSPILTRLYSPAEFGVFAAAASLLGVLITITTLSYRFAIPLPESDDEAATIVVLSLVVATIMSSLTAVVLLLFGQTVLTTLGAAALGPFAVLLAVSQFAEGTVAVFRAWAVRTRSYGRVGAQRVMQSFALAATQVAFGLAGAGALGLLLGAVLASFSGAVGFARHAWQGHAQSFKAVTIAGVRAAASRYRRFPLFGAPSRFLSSVARQAPVLAMVALYGVTVAGQFAMAQRVVMMPIGLIASSVGQAYLGEAARLAKTEPDRLMRIWVRTTRSLALAALPPLLIAMVAAPIVFGIVLGEEWTEAGVFAAILAPAYYLHFITGATANTFDIVERQDLLGLMLAGRLAFTAVWIALAVVLNLTPVAAVIVLSVLECVDYSISGLLSWHAIRTHTSRHPASPEPR
jgi:O-antigen/teichoic acid export membrane protein